jgi:CheY-like chemotaxis protein/GAF domain-containing protein
LKSVQDDKQLALEIALRDETRMLGLLNQTGMIIAAELDLKVLLQSVIDAATELIDARYGVVALNTAGERGDTFVARAATGIAAAAFDRFAQAPVASPFALVASDAPAIRCRDVRADERWGTSSAKLSLPGHLPVRSYLAVPVRSRLGEVIGGLFFAHPDADKFSERSERLVLGVAAQAAVAIDNARLYESAQQAAAERKELLDRERTARDHAERLSASKDEFLATLSHELRTPLTSILGWAHVLRHGSGSRDDLQKGLEVIERNARAQTQLIEDLLDRSRITSGKVRLDIQPVQRSGLNALPEHPAAERAVPPDFQPLDLSGVKVLLVDDESDAHGLVERLLIDCKAEVLIAPTAEAALAAVERERPHVLLSDIGMPEMDGYELLRRIRALGEERGGKVPAIALTAFARPEDRTRALRAGFQVHVSKPIEPAKLIAAVASIVGRMGAPE